MLDANHNNRTFFLSLLGWLLTSESFCLKFPKLTLIFRQKFAMKKTETIQFDRFVIANPTIHLCIITLSLQVCYILACGVRAVGGRICCEKVAPRNWRWCYTPLCTVADKPGPFWCCPDCLLPRRPTRFVGAPTQAAFGKCGNYFNLALF